jgi:putative phage-type endonuclease
MPRLTSEQLAERRNGLGSSDVAAILGFSPYRSAIDVYAEKCGIVEPEEPGEEAEIGHELEPWMLAWYVRETGQPLHLGGTCRHPSLPWAFATIDGRAEARFATIPALKARVVEIKIVGGRMMYDWRTDVDDGVPDYVRVQNAWQLACIPDVDQVDTAACLGATTRRIFRINRDPDLERMIVDRCDEFWRRYVLERREPPLDHTPTSRKILEAKFPIAEPDNWLAATADVEALGHARIEAAKRASEGEETRKRIDHELRAIIGTHTGLVAERFRVSWKAPRPGAVRHYKFTAKGERS